MSTKGRTRGRTDLTGKAVREGTVAPHDVGELGTGGDADGNDGG